MYWYSLSFGCSYSVVNLLQHLQFSSPCCHSPSTHPASVVSSNVPGFVCSDHQRLNQAVSLVQAPLSIFLNALCHWHKKKPSLPSSFTQIPPSPTHVSLWIFFKSLFHTLHAFVVWGKSALLLSPFLAKGTLLSSCPRQFLWLINSWSK